MSDVMISAQGMGTNHSFLPLSIEVHICPHCGETVPTLAGRWSFTSRTSRAYHCPVCGDDMHDDALQQESKSGATVEDLTARQRDVLQAIQESGPIRHDDLAHKAGVSERTVTNAVRVLKELGVKSTPAGYIFESLP